MPVVAGGKPVGTISRPSKGAPQNIPGWVLLFGVADVFKAARKVEALGGKVMTHPFATPDGGTVAVVQAPGGEIFCLRQVSDQVFFLTDPTVLPWMEVVTRDPDQAKTFYSALFGWTFSDIAWQHGSYTSIMHEGRRIGGLVQYSPAFGDQAFEAALRGKPTIEKEAIIPHWMVFFGVDDLVSALGRADAAGAVYRGRMYEIPELGRFAMVRDPLKVFMSLLEVGALP